MTLIQELAAIENETRHLNTNAYRLDVLPDDYEIYLLEHGCNDHVMSFDEWEGSQPTF